MVSKRCSMCSCPSKRDMFMFLNPTKPLPVMLSLKFSQTNKQEHETNMLIVFLETIVTIPNVPTYTHNCNQHNCNEPREKMIPLHTSKKLYVMPNLCLRVVCVKLYVDWL